MITLKKFQAAALAAVMALALAGVARAHEHRDSDDAAGYAYRNGYRDGFEHGSRDHSQGAGYEIGSREYASADRGYRDDMGSLEEYRESYRLGYKAGYRDAFADRAAQFDNDRDPGPDRGYGRYHSVAISVGYQDGLLAGKRDSSKGKKFRPEKNDQYEDADHGYRKEYGNKNLYKQEYRQSFVQGYQAGFDQGGGPGR